ncbi:MAG TPA: PHP domain-containing protein [Candidatus Limnocylindrales bacterium]|nr:PHP domain-containing protein [Candidatus Limnocylindrales bacterium]
MAYAELHCHTNFSFLDGASMADALVERAVTLGLAAIAVTDRSGLYGAVRFAAAATEAGIAPVIGVEIELTDPCVADPAGIVVPERRRWRPGGRRSQPVGLATPEPVDGMPVRPRPARRRPPGHRDVVKEDLRGIGDPQRGPHLVLLAHDDAGYRSLCRLASRAHLAGTKGAPRFSQALLAAHTEGLIALSGCREGEVARRLRAGDREGARMVARRYAALFGTLHVELSHHLLPDDDWLVSEAVALADELSLPVVVTNDVHYAEPDDRELHDVLTAIRHGRTLETLGDLRRSDGESYLKGEADLLALPPADPARAGERVARRWREGIAAAAELAAACTVDLGFERYRFPGFPVPEGETAYSHLSQLCWDGARRRYHPLSSPVVRQLAHELDVIERTGLAEFFLICADLMRFARERRIPAQGRGSAADSIVAYALGITRVDPIRHNLLFERFINEGRTTYPDVDIDFSSARREEVIQYVYERYGTEHTGMVCNVVTYRARSAVREVGYALGFPRPLVDRVAKALETYDSVMVRRDLEADGGFAEFFHRPGDDPDAVDATAISAALAGARGFVDRMGRLNGPRPGPDLSPEARSTGSAIDDDDYAWSDTESVGIDGPSPVLGPDRSSRTAMADRLATKDRLAPRTSIRGGGLSDDEGGPGDTPVSVAWLRGDGPAGTTRGPAGTTRGAPRAPSGSAEGRPTDRLGRPAHWDPPPPTPRSPRTSQSSVARLEPEPSAAARGGSTRLLSDWERWLELCARLDGFPRHLSIHNGGMLVTAAPLIDIAPLERATMAGRVVVQYDKRDVETIKLVKLDLLGLGMLAAIDETLALIEHDCAVCIDLDRIPEEIPEVFAMLCAADTVGVFQVESRAQMQTLPKSRPQTLDDLVVEVAIIRPGPIQGNAVHPYLRRRQGIEPVTYPHPSLEPILGETLGVILYQEQVMRIAIDVAGFTPAESDGFRRAMGTWRSTREMEKLHARFVDGCLRQPGMDPDTAEELFGRVAAFASFGFAKSHAAAFARTAYESAFLKLFYPAQFLVGLINAQPMGFYPVEVLVNDTKRHGVTVLPIDINASAHRTTTEWVGRPGWALAGERGDDGSADDETGEPLPDGCGIDERPRPVRSPACVIPTAAARTSWAAESATGWGVRLGLHLVKGIGDEQAERLDAELARGPYRSLVDVVERTGLPEEVLERLIRAGALDSIGAPRRQLLWQLREVAGSARGRMDGRALRSTSRVSRRAAGRPVDLRLPPTDAPDLPPPTESERIGDAYAVVGLDARLQVVSLFRPALDRLGAIRNGDLATHRAGRVVIGGLVVTRQHPMTAKGTVFLAMEDETGMVNVTLWPDTWARLRGVVRRHALLLVDGTLQREGDVVNVVARAVLPLPDAAAAVGGPAGTPPGVRQLGYAGMRRIG